MSKKNYKKSRKYKKMRRRKIIFGMEIAVLLILSGILFVYAWINRSMDKMNQDTLDTSVLAVLGRVGWKSAEAPTTGSVMVSRTRVTLAASAVAGSRASTMHRQSRTLMIRFFMKVPPFLFRNIFLMRLCFA